MNRQDQLYNALVIFADLIGARVAAHMKGQKPICPPEEYVLNADEAAELFTEWAAKRDGQTMEEGDSPRSERRLIPVKEWNKYHDYPKEGGLRNLIFNAESNGFSKVIRRVGRRVLIDEAAFLEWVDEQNGQEGG